MSHAVTHTVWLNGSLFAPGAPVIRADDPGFLLGLAVFETLLCEQGRVFYVEQHVERLQAAAQTLGLPWPGGELARAGLAALAGQLGVETAALRLTLTPGGPGAGPQLLVTARAWTAPDVGGVVVAISKATKALGLGLENVKTSSRARNVLARSRAQELGAYEALLCTEDGDLSEGTVSNLFLVVGEELVTPALSRACLPGIVRQRVLDIALDLGIPVQERRVEFSELAGCQGVFLTSSLVRILPVVRVLGLERDFPAGGDPVTRRLKQRFIQLEAGNPLE